METNIIVQDRINENVVELSIILNKIYDIRGYKVILDFDLAERYEVETKRLKEAVRRNMNRFPSDFMFELTTQEWKNLRSQIATSSWGGSRYQPFAFTEQGVAMLSGLLNSEVAVNTNILIMRAFVMSRQYALSYVELKQELENFIRETNARLDKNDMRFEKIFKLFDEFIEHKKELEKPRTPIGFKRKN